jgi:hypothetical protein
MAYWDGWLYQKEITVTPPTLSGAVAGYCALVKLDSTNFDFSKAKSGGADVRFGWLDGSDFTLHYIQKWDSVGEEALISVYIPSIPVAGTTFYLFYGNSSADDSSNSIADYFRYRTKAYLVRDGEGNIQEVYKGENLVRVGSGAYPAASTGIAFGASESFDGDTVAGCWKTAPGQWWSLDPSNPYDLVFVVLAYPTVNDAVHRPAFAQGSLTNNNYAVMLELYNGNWVWNNGPSVAAVLNEWNLVMIRHPMYTGDPMSISVNGGTPVTATLAGYSCSGVDEDFYIGGSYAITTNGTERAFKGKVELVAISNPNYYSIVSSDDWEALLYAELIEDSLIYVEPEAGGESSGGSSSYGDSSSSGWEDSSSGGSEESSSWEGFPDVDGPTESQAVIVTPTTSTILSANVSLEPYGVTNAHVRLVDSVSVGDYLELEDPVDDTPIFKGIVTKCERDHKNPSYSIQLQDPISALSQGEVLFSNTNMITVLGEVATDYDQVFYTAETTSYQLAPVEVGAVIDPDNEVESDPVNWVDLVKTVERALNLPVTFRPNCQYRIEAPTSLGTLTNSQILNATTTILQSRYANRVIAKCVGEWWEDPGEETTSTEFIYGAYRTVKRYGDQVRSISINTDDLDYTETFTYDEDSYLTKHEVVSIQEDNSPLSGIARYRTTTTREWTITDEANYTYEEEVINEQQVEGLSYANLDRTVKTVIVSGGEVWETCQRYGWNYESGWHVLMNDYTITGSGDEINAGDGSYYEIRGFLPQPGLASYGVKSIYEYVWIDEIEGTYRRRLQKTDVASGVSAPGFKRVLPLKKYAVSYCVTAEDSAAITALGLKEKTYQPVTVKDDANLTVMKAIVENHLAWCCRCRQLEGSVAFDLAKEWRIGDTFSWNGLTWTIEYLDHDLKARKTSIKATSEASIAALKKALLPEMDALGNSIKGIARKEAEKFDNVESATIVSMVDYETYVVKLSDGRVKIAHLSFGEGILLPVGSSVTVLRDSLR